MMSASQVVELCVTLVSTASWIEQSYYNKFTFNFGATGLQQNLFTCEILFPVHFFDIISVPAGTDQ